MLKRDRRRANIFDPADNNDLANYWRNNNEETIDDNDMTDEEVNEMLHNLTLDATVLEQLPVDTLETDEEKLISGGKWQSYNAQHNNLDAQMPPESIRSNFQRAEQVGASNIPWGKLDESKKEIDYFQLFMTDSDFETIGKDKKKLRHIAVQYNKDKPNKWHIKGFGLNDSRTGYLSNFYLYQGSYQDKILRDNESSSQCGQ